MLLGHKRKLRAWWQARPKDARALLVLSVLPFLIFLFGPNKDVKFVAPILPVLALLTASLLGQAVETHRWRAAITALLLAFPMLAFLHASFGVLRDSQLKAAGLVFASKQLPYAQVYDPHGWPHRQILKRIVQAGSFHDGEKKVGMIGTLNLWKCACVGDPSSPRAGSTSASFTYSTAKASLSASWIIHSRQRILRCLSGVRVM